MRVAVFHNLTSGGAKRALYGFVRYLTRQGHTVDAFLPDTADESFLPLAAVTRRCEMFPVKRTLVGTLVSTVRYMPSAQVSIADLEQTQRRIAAAINQQDYDVVLAEQDQFVMSPFVLKFLTRPTVYYCQQPFRILPERDGRLTTRLWIKLFRNRVLPALDRRNAQSAQRILANSYFSRDVIRAAYGRDAFVCYLGVDVEVFRPLDVAREPFVLSVGSITPNKCHDFLVRALGFVPARRRPRLVLIGNVVDASWKNGLERLAAETGVQLEIQTMLSEPELVLQYNRATLFLYAPYREPFGLAPLEAMACRTPVVAVNEGGVRETVQNGKSGVLTERDERSFAVAIERLLLDEAAQKELGSRGHDAVHALWTVEQAGQRLLKHLPLTS